MNISHKYVILKKIAINMNRPVNIPNHSHALPTGVSTITKSMLDEIRDQDQIKYVIIPQGVNSIEKEAFKNYKHLASITIPDGVTS